MNEGFIYVLKALESCRSVKVIGVDWQEAKAGQFYLTINRKLMKHVFDSNSITYQRFDNSFADISDGAKAQKLRDKFDSVRLCHRLDVFAKSISLFPDTVQKNFGRAISGV